MQNNYFDPKDKNSETDDQPIQREENEEAVYIVNNDGTPFDNSERTYVSVDLPEEKTDKDN